MKAHKKFLALALSLIVALTITATACAPNLDKIEVTTAPAKTEYFEGQKFDPEGMVVTATYGDESTAVITDYTYEPAGELKATDTQITISYKGKTVTQAITVSEVEVTEVEVTQNPAKTEYKAGEKFAADGLKVTAHYNDGTSAEITDYTVKPKRALIANDQNAFVTVGNVTANVAITVEADPEAVVYEKVPVYKAIGTMEAGGQKVTMGITFYNDYTIQGLLESGMGASVDGMLGKFLSFPGVWEKNGDDFYAVLNSFTFDPSTLKGLASAVPEDMKDLFDSLLEMDPIDIEGCMSPVTVDAENNITFNGSVSAMGLTVPMEGKGNGAPASIEVKAGEPVEAELGDYSKMKSTSASAAIFKEDAKFSGNYYLQYCANPGNVWKMTVNCKAEAKGTELKFNMLGYKKGYNVSDYLTLKVNGIEVEFKGDLGASISKLIDFAVTIDLKAGDNTIELIWKDNPVNDSGAEQKITNFKFDYVTFATDVTVVNPSFVPEVVQSEG